MVGTVVILLKAEEVIEIINRAAIRLHTGLRLDHWGKATSTFSFLSSIVWLRLNLILFIVLIYSDFFDFSSTHSILPLLFSSTHFFIRLVLLVFHTESEKVHKEST